MDKIKIHKDSPCTIFFFLHFHKKFLPFGAMDLRFEKKSDASIDT